MEIEAGVTITACSRPAETPDVYIVERLFSSSLVVVVSTAMPQRMNIYHFKKGTEICNYSYPNTILAVKLNRQVSHLQRSCTQNVPHCSPAHHVCILDLMLLLHLHDEKRAF